MRTVSIVSLLVLVGLSLQITPQELIAAVNKARVNPTYYANKIKTKYLDAGVKGRSNDPLCYEEAYNNLTTAAPLPVYKESMVADCAARQHNDYMVLTKTLTHSQPAPLLNPKNRLELFGAWPTAAFSYNENVAKAMATENTAEDFVTLWIADCGVSSRGHRNNIYSIKVNQYGCAHSDLYATCVGTITLNPTVTDAQLTAFGLSRAVNDVGFAGY